MHHFSLTNHTTSATMRAFSNQCRDLSARKLKDGDRDGSQKDNQENNSKKGSG
jgi:hypothetical protein